VVVVVNDKSYIILIGRVAWFGNEMYIYLTIK